MGRGTLPVRAVKAAWVSRRSEAKTLDQKKRADQAQGLARKSRRTGSPLFSGVEDDPARVKGSVA